MTGDHPLEFDDFDAAQQAGSQLMIWQMVAPWLDVTGLLLARSWMHWDEIRSVCDRYQGLAALRTAVLDQVCRRLVSLGEDVDRFIATGELQFGVPDDASALMDRDDPGEEEAS